MKWFAWRRRDHHDREIDKAIETLRKQQKHVDARITRLEVEAGIVTRSTDQLLGRPGVTA